MWTSLLVGLDGSMQGQMALAQAILIGQRFRSRIVMVHVAPPPGRTGEMALGAPWMEWTPSNAPSTRLEHEQAAQLMLDDAAGAVRRAGLEAETSMREGHVAEILRQMADAVGVVLVGRIGPRRDAPASGADPLGPDTRELIRRCPRPVLVCGSRPTPMSRVLVAYGGGPASEGALAFASRFAGITGAHLDVLHVATDQGEGRSALARASGVLSLAPLDFETHLIEGDLESVIPHTVRRLGSDALFAGAHREESGWKVPSHTEVILRVTDIPVLVHMHHATPGARVTTANRRSPS
jgi:nucleotide-binding universal stress UspA family protein